MIPEQPVSDTYDLIACANCPATSAAIHTTHVFEGAANPCWNGLAPDW